MKISDLSTGKYPYKIFKKNDVLPVRFRDLISHSKIDDTITLLEAGKEWAYELTRTHQPRSAEQLLNGSNLTLLLRESELVGYVSVVVQEINGVVIRIGRDFLGRNPSDKGFDKIKYSSTSRYFSLPEPIRLA